MNDSTNSTAKSNVIDITTAFAKATPKAHAQVKADLAEGEKSAALQAGSPLKSRDDMKGFLKHHPVTGKLLGVIFNVWRRSTARRSGSAGCWAAHLHPEWAKHAKMSVATLKRHLDRLEEHGLIERQRGPFAGTPGVSFIRPTALALKLSDSAPGDRKHLGLEIGKPDKSIATPAKSPVKQQQADEKPATLDELMTILSDEKSA